jgi:hypothetical protein
MKQQKERVIAHHVLYLQDIVCHADTISSLLWLLLFSCEGVVCCPAQE